MQPTIREISAGGVVFQADAGGHQILLVQDRHGRWCLPKGGVEAGETHEQAALREVKEETGISGEIRLPLGESRYTYRDHRGTITKTVHYFLVQATGGEVVAQRSEVQDARWFPKEEALSVFGYANTRHILRSALKHLE